MAYRYRASLPMSMFDVDAMNRLVGTEVPTSVYNKDPGQFQRMVDGVVESVMNRAVSPQFSPERYDNNKYPSYSVQDIAEAPAQYSAINGRVNGKPPQYAGNVFNAPVPSDETQRAVARSLLSQAASGQETFPGVTHYMNPSIADRSNVNGWGRSVISPENYAGVGTTAHYYGNVPDKAPSYGTPQFNQQDMQSLAQSALGIGRGMAGPLAADSIDRANDYGTQAFNQQNARNRMQNLMSAYDNTQTPQAPAPTLGDRITNAITSPFTVAAQAVGGMFSAPADSAPRPPAPVQQPQRPVSYSPLNAAPNPAPVTSQPLAPLGMPSMPQRPVSQTPAPSAPAPQSMPATPGLAPSGRPMASMSPQQQIMGQYQSNFGLPGLAAGTASELGLPNADPSFAAAAQAARAAQSQQAPFSMPQRPMSPTPVPAPAAVSPTAPPGTPAQPQAPLGQVARQAATGLLSAGLPVAAAALPGAPLAAAAIASAMPQAKPVTPTPIAPSVAPAPLSPAPSVAPGPQANPNAPTVGTTGLPAGPEMNPGLNTTARPTTMGQIGGGLKSAAKVGRTAMAGAKVGGLVAGPVGGLVGLGLGAGIPLAGMAMDAAGTNVNQLFGGPVPHPGSAPATSRDVVPFAAPSVLSQVNRMDLGPAPQGYSYGYSPFGNNVSLVSNNANEAAHIAATGPGILGAFGFGTSKDGYNNGTAAAAQNAATNTAKATQSKTDAKANATQSQNSSSSNSSSKSSGSGSGKTGGGQNGNGDKKQSSY